MWKVEDVDAINSGLTPEQQTKWVAVANNILKGCMSRGGDEKTCAASAIKAANGMVKK